MSVAYVDTSCLVAIAFGEPGGRAMARRTRTFDTLLASNLVEAELHSAFAREQVAFDDRLTSSLRWILPDRSLAPEIALALAAGYLRGADLWHVAAALFVSGADRALTFLTLDDRQREVAERLGFAV